LNKKRNEQETKSPDFFQENHPTDYMLGSLTQTWTFHRIFPLDPLTPLSKLKHLLQTPIPHTVLSQSLFVFVNIQKVKSTGSITGGKFYCRTFQKINQKDVIFLQRSEEA
jgi:hypothetical protein